MRRGLFIGRFQPFHNGHLGALRQILKECDEAVVAVGSSQRSHEPENLFTIGERVEMIHLALKEEDLLGKCVVVGVPDIRYNSVWTAHLRALAPRFDIVYSNNSLVRRLFTEAGVTVKPIALADRQHNDGTFIRKSMARSREWERYVPKAVTRFVREVKGVERLRDISGTDKLAVIE